jgi:protein ImuB
VLTRTSLAPRLLCVHVPMWSIDRLRRRLNRTNASSEREGGWHGQTVLRLRKAVAQPALLLVQTRANMQHIAACCRESRAAGVRPGMMLAQARAMIGGEIHVEAFDPGAERAAMQRLARWAALRFSPIVSVDPCTLSEKISADEPLPDGIVLDITGCDRLFVRTRGGERMAGEIALASAILRPLRSAGFEANIGIGPTIGAAWAAARFGDPPVTILPSNHLELRRALEPLPVRALRIDAQTVQGLTELGIERIGQLLDLPRRMLPSRFGPLLVRRLDQAFGSAIETIEPVRPRPAVRVERIFDGPTPQQEAIELCSRELLIELAQHLQQRESGVRLLEAVFERIGRNGRGTELLTERLTLSRGTRDPRHLWSLLRPRIERLHLGYGIESITLTALRMGRLRHKQDEYIERGHQSAASEGEGQLIDTLANRLGVDRVLRAELVESHIPERAQRFIPALGDGDARHGQRQAVAHAPTTNIFSSPIARPPFLFEHPEPAEAIALAPDRPPTVLRWRGQERRIVAGFGPERLAGEWWRIRQHARPGEPAGDAWERDYFRVCDEAGQWLWVYRVMPLYRPQDVPVDAARARPVRWFVHGIWT